jgi:glycosyltransferase involved in cell wall biosynthesis
MISVVVCTYNRAGPLQRFLARIGELGTPRHDLPWELVVIDNNSSDGTRDVVESMRAQLPVPIAYHFEGRQGLSHARNAAFKAARYDILAFTDDDCLFGSDWLRSIAEEFTADPNLAILGGRVEAGPGLPSEISTRRNRERVEVKSLTDIRRNLIGCNMALKRSVLKDVEPFDTRLGAGTPCKAGEDSDYIYRALRRGRRILYSPDVLVEHHHDRTGEDAVRAVRGNYLMGRGAFYAKHLLLFDCNVARHAYWELRGLLRRNERRSSFGSLTRWQVLRGLLSGGVLWLRSGRADSDKVN